MSFDAALALIAFALVTSLTPGPNNLMLLASGANFGFRRTVPHMLGVSLGFCVMLLLLGLGLAQVFTLYPWVHTALKAVSVAYLLYLAWRIAHAAAPGDGAAGGRPFSFLQAAAFQWVNPKAWAMALTTVTVYTEAGAWGALLVATALFGGINFPSVALWVTLGQQVRRFLTDARRLRLFNWTMAALLVASLYPVLFA